MNMIDHHCDLLCALAERDNLKRCDPAQMIAGGLTHQILPIFTATSGESVSLGQKQFEIFLQLSANFPGAVQYTGSVEHFPLTVMLAIENASSFCSETEPLETGLQRLSEIIKRASPLMYISLTWSGQNRFGGGNGSTLGITDDGKSVLRFLDGRGIPIDFSHTSDWLATGILETIDSERLNIPILASHSNFRSVTDHVRNLPDSIAKEIIARDGIIGLNVIRPFVGAYEDYARHLAYGIVELSGHNAMVLGCDYFEQDLNDQREMYFEELNDSSAISKIRERIQLDFPALTDRVTIENSRDFYRRIGTTF